MEATFRRLTEVALTRPAFLRSEYGSEYRSSSWEFLNKVEFLLSGLEKLNFRFGFLSPLSSAEILAEEFF